MDRMLALARKDLRLLLRDKVGFGFTFVFPMVYCIFFGLIFGGTGSGGGSSKIKIAVCDDDQSAESQKFVERLRQADEVEVFDVDFETARGQVRTGKRVALIRIPQGFGDKQDGMFYGESAEIEIGLDPSRQAEAGMLQGIIMRTAFEGMQDMFTDAGAMQARVDGWLKDLGEDDDANPAAKAALRLFLPALSSFTTTMNAAGDGDGGTNGGGGAFSMEPVRMKKVDIERKRRSGPVNAFSISFPQGIIWGVMGCAAGFGISLVQERTGGTLVRLRTAPVRRWQILGGKALACWLTIMVMMAFLFTLGGLGFKVRPSSVSMLLLAAFCTAVCFSGIMMVLSVLGKTEQAAGGLSWGILIVLAMFGGGMFPLFAMPKWMLTVSSISPVKWAILAMEGAVWRSFSLTEMLPACGILLAVGLVCFGLGSRLFQWTES
ncbi:MAG: ABC transporter permease [Planctomycetota bacterium]|jgi:ABC-2 type transport system permease protein